MTGPIRDDNKNLRSELWRDGVKTSKHKSSKELEDYAAGGLFKNNPKIKNEQVDIIFKYTPHDDANDYVSDSFENPHDKDGNYGDSTMFTDAPNKIKKYEDMVAKGTVTVDGEEIPVTTISIGDLNSEALKPKTAIKGVDTKGDISPGSNDPYAVTHRMNSAKNTKIGWGDSVHNLNRNTTFDADREYFSDADLNLAYGMNKVVLQKTHPELGKDDIEGLAKARAIADCSEFATSATSRGGDSNKSLQEKLQVKLGVNIKGSDDNSTGNLASLLKEHDDYKQASNVLASLGGSVNNMEQSALAAKLKEAGCTDKAINQVFVEILGKNMDARTIADQTENAGVKTRKPTYETSIGVVGSDAVKLLNRSDEIQRLVRANMPAASAYELAAGIDGSADANKIINGMLDKFDKDMKKLAESGYEQNFAYQRGLSPNYISGLQAQGKVITDAIKANPENCKLFEGVGKDDNGKLKMSEANIDKVVKAFSDIFLNYHLESTARQNNDIGDIAGKFEEATGLKLSDEQKAQLSAYYPSGRAGENNPPSTKYSGFATIVPDPQNTYDAQTKSNIAAMKAQLEGLSPEAKAIGMQTIENYENTRKNNSLFGE